MQYHRIPHSSLEISTLGLGTMTFGEQNSEADAHQQLDYAVANGINLIDVAEMYPVPPRPETQGLTETYVGNWLAKRGNREKLVLASKVSGPARNNDSSIRPNHVLDRKNIREALHASLKRLQTDYLDLLLLHRPDALVEPEEVAAAFDVLFESGKVRHFGVSNHKPMQIALLQKYVCQPLVVNQVQFSIPVSNLVANGMEVNMETPGSVDHDGSLLDYCRLHDITLQAWSPFQMPSWKGCFLGSDEYPELNQKIRVLAEKYGVSDTTIAAAWILRHPANMQLVTGTASEKRLKEIIAACNITLTREEWYELYLAAGHPLP